MRKIDYVVIIIDTIAAILTAVGSVFGAPFFVLASCIGLYDFYKTGCKVLSGAIINSIFLALNLYFTVVNIVLPLL